MALRIEDRPEEADEQPRIADVASYVRRVAGRELTAAMVGAKDVTTVDRWAEGHAAPDRGSARRLRDAYAVTRTLLRAEPSETARAWLMGMNPALDDRAPAAVLAEDPAAVLRAARFLVANG